MTRGMFQYISVSRAARMVREAAAVIYYLFLPLLISPRFEEVALILTLVIFVSKLLFSNDYADGTHHVPRLDSI